MIQNRRHEGRRNSRFNRWFKVLLFAVGTGAAAVLVFFAATRQEGVPFAGKKNVILINGVVQEQSYLEKEGQILLPLTFLREKVDPTLHWEESSQTLIITTKDKVLRMQQDTLQDFLRQRPVSLRVPIQQAGGEWYVPFEPLRTLYPIQLRKTESGSLVLETDGEAYQQGKVGGEKGKDETYLLREDPSLFSPVVGTVKDGAIVDVFGEKDGWYQVLTPAGLIGYVDEDDVTLTTIRRVSLEKAESSPRKRWKPLGKAINLVWEYVYRSTPKGSEIPPMPGVHVVSPTWFELMDGEGNIGNKADMQYVQWAHERGYQVWALFSNGFNPDWTHAVLSDMRKRQNVIARLLHYADMYNLDGINLDFENVYLEDKQKLVQFVRELTPYLHEKGLTVSMEVTVKSISERWSLFYDRKALAETVDYIALMAYDEHWATSPIAGSVASLPWVEKSVRGVLEEVPPQKLLLGVPFYTRLWKEERQADGTVKVTSKALSMKQTQEWIAERKLKPQVDQATGQRFVSYRDPADGAVYKVWLEDWHSLKQRIDLVHKYRLAGIAGWRRGFEDPALWRNIEQELQ